MTPPKNLAPNKFQERQSGASRMQENLIAARAAIRIPLEELTTLLQPTNLGRRNL